MHVLVNGVRLFFDVEGAKLVPDGPSMRERPTLVLLHGGPGFDHTIYKPAYSALADIAQVIYFDHRGNGRSDAGPKESWTLAQWGDDLRAFCHALGIREADRAGCFVRRHGGDGLRDAASFASRQADPDHHRGEGQLLSRKARGIVRAVGGPEVGALARRRFLETKGTPDEAAVAAWRRLAMPHYTRTPRGADALKRGIVARRAALVPLAPRRGKRHRFNLFPTFTASSARRW